MTLPSNLPRKIAHRGHRGEVLYFLQQPMHGNLFIMEQLDSCTILYRAIPLTLAALDYPTLLLTTNPEEERPKFTPVGALLRKPHANLSQWEKTALAELKSALTPLERLALPLRIKKLSRRAENNVRHVVNPNR